MPLAKERKVKGYPLFLRSLSMRHANKRKYRIRKGTYKTHQYLDTVVIKACTIKTAYKESA
jgi:hypothetical protein